MAAQKAAEHWQEKLKAEQAKAAAARDAADLCTEEFTVDTIYPAC
jgi:hypothetical protein